MEIAANSATAPVPSQPPAASSPSPSASSPSFDRQSAVDAEYAIQRAAKTSADLNARRATAPLTEKIAKFIPPPIDPIALAREERLQVEREAQRKADADRVFGRLMKSSNVPARYAVEAWNTDALPADAAAIADVKMNRLREVARPGTIVAVIGPRGTGKTHMVCCLVREVCTSGQSAIYMDAMDYLLAVRSTYGGKGEEKQVENDHATVDLLVLDEMQERGETAWEDRMLTRLVNKRYAANKITILLSNQDRATFSERVGESIASRIEDGGGVIVCDWQSVRGRLNAK